MRCNTKYINPIVFKQDLNKEILENIYKFPDGIRKELRYLAKQYEILESYQEKPEVSTSERIVRNMPFVIKYRSFDGGSIFQWTINPERLK